jgi:nucleotide-binding universal stress UspA family protein
MLKSKVLLPSDGSYTSTKAAAYAARLMKMNKEMKLTVLVVLPRDNVFPDPENRGRETMEPAVREMQDRGGEILQKTVEFFSKEGLSVNGLIDKGDPAEVILAHAERGNFDHIIMGSRGVSELKGVELGSVSHKVIHLAGSRVTLVK